jgi:hypothetical protein
MSDWQKTHWQLFNALGKLIGVGFIFVGGIFSIWGISLLLDPKATIDVDGGPTNDPSIKATTLIVGLIVLALGVLLVIAKPFRPDLEDSGSPKKD